MKTTRRQLLGATLGFAGSIFLPRNSQASSQSKAAESRPPPVPRPHLLVTTEKIPGLRSLNELRASITNGHGRILWEELKAKADLELTIAPFHGGRRDYTIVNATALRVLRHALAFLITGKTQYRDAAVAQIETTFDSRYWTDWKDAVAPVHWHTGLRMGQLCCAFGLAYDWLHTSLTPEQRKSIVDGMDRCAIQPYLKAVETGSWVVGALSNFVSVISGGLAIAGMAFEDDHPDSERLVALGQERVGAYLHEFGPDGEWNESVGYSASVVNAVAFFSTLRYWSATRPGVSRDLPIEANKTLARFCYWLMYMTRPHGREALFGNAHKVALQRRISLSYVPAVAAAERDGVLQDYYLQNLFPSADTMDMRNLAFELVWYDQTLPPVRPDGRLPQGRVFPAITGCVSSRANWDPRATPCMVFGKGGLAYEINGHNDAAQVCIDGYGEPLIVDLGGYHIDQGGSPTLGLTSAHNVLMFDGENMRRDRPLARAMYNAPERRLKPALKSIFLQHEFDDRRGGFWTLDTSEIYDGVDLVRRTVVHLNPGIVIVQDTAVLPRERVVSLRWHTADKCEPQMDGSFLVIGRNGARLSAQVACLEKEPFHVRRNTHPETGDSSIEFFATRKTCTILTLFSVSSPEVAATSWVGRGGSWNIPTSSGIVDVTCTPKELSVRYRDGDPGWKVTLAGSNQRRVSG